MGLCEQHLSNSIREIFTGTRDPAVSGTELPVLWTMWTGGGMPGQQKCRIFREPSGVHSRAAEKFLGDNKPAWAANALHGCVPASCPTWTKSPGQEGRRVGSSDTARQGGRQPPPASGLSCLTVLLGSATR